MTVGDDVLKFGYDASGSPMYLQFNNSRYFYATNVQGDVTALVHTSGTAVVEYTYDAWGNILTTTGSMASTLGQINPLRYRGYVYDAETRLYYLQSRYYDPTTGRFLNADALVSTGQGILGNNMFAYCNNNPANYCDPSGCLRFDVTTNSFGDADWGQRPSVFLDAIYSKTNGVINGQAAFEFSSNSFGLGIYAKNGCGSIAVYNALQLLGCGVSLGMVTDQFIHHNGMIFGGLMGVNPWCIDDILAEHDVSTIGYGSYWELEQNLSNNDIIIYAVINNANKLSDGAHFMTAQYINGEFLVYNISNKRITPKPVPSIDPANNVSVWIYGYIIGG